MPCRAADPVSRDGIPLQLAGGYTNPYEAADEATARPPELEG